MAFVVGQPGEACGVKAPLQPFEFSSRIVYHFRRPCRNVAKQPQCARQAAHISCAAHRISGGYILPERPSNAATAGSHGQEPVAMSSLHWTMLLPTDIKEQGRTVG